jgi:hypothetical protein
MAQRTTLAQVQTRLQRDYDYNRNPDLQQAIDMASPMVDEIASYASTLVAYQVIPMPTSRLELIERNLACHFYVMSDQPYSSNSTSGASASYQGQTKMYLEASKYGQMAITMDSSGWLRAMYATDTPKVANALWLGKNPSDQIDYIYRR